MLLEGTNSSTFRMSIEGYQFPKAIGSTRDQNWLNITVWAEDESGYVKFSAPCLLSWEIEELAQWFISIENKVEESNVIDFVEGILRFGLTRNSNAELLIIVKMILEYEESWIYYDGYEPEKTMFKTLKISLADSSLQNAIQALEGTLTKFPIR